MSIQAMNWALGKETGSPAVKVVLLTLANYANQNGAAFPSHEQLAEETEQSTDSVARKLQELVKLGLIYKTHRYSKNSNGGRRTNEYVVLHDERARTYARELGWEELARADEEQSAREAAEQSERAPAEEAYAADCGLTHGEVNPQIEGGLTRNGAGYSKEDSNLEPKPIPPLPPKGGMGGRASRFDDFQKVWPFDLVDLVEPARRLFLRLSDEDQALAVKWAPSYVEASKAQSRKRMTAANWLRGKGWQAFKAKPDTAAVAMVFIREGSPQWLAWERWHREAKDVRMPGGKLFAAEMKIGRGRYEKSEWPPPKPKDGAATA